MATTETTTLKVAVEHIRIDHGYAAVAYELAASVGWQARHYGGSAEKIRRAAQLLAEAAGLLEQLEAEEDSRE